MKEADLARLVQVRLLNRMLGADGFAAVGDGEGHLLTLGLGKHVQIVTQIGGIHQVQRGAEVAFDHFMKVKFFVSVKGKKIIAGV